MIIEIHTHTAEHSPCSMITAAELVVGIHEKGASGLVLTDHHYLWPEEEIEKLRSSLRIHDNFLILSGQEVFTTDFGDILVYGADESITQRISLAALRRRYPSAALVWAHPYRGGQRPSTIELFNADLDAIEILNPRQRDHENAKGMEEWQQWGFVATSGSDIHEKDFAAFYPVFLERSIGNINDLASCIKQGLCNPGKFAGQAFMMPS